MYRKGEEAVFWSTAEECAAKCEELLRNPERRDRIAQAGQARCKKNGLLNEQVLSHILDVALFGERSTQ